MKPTKTARKGRPLEPELGGRILTTTLRLLARSGYHALNLDDVAAECATSKQALYRRWPGKSQLAAAAVVDGLAKANAVVPDSGSAIEDLTMVLDNAIDAWQSTPLGGALRALLSEHANRDLAACLCSADAERRQVLRSILNRARRRKEVRCDVELTIDTLLGGAWLRYLLDGRVPKNYAKKAVLAWFDGAHFED